MKTIQIICLAAACVACGQDESEVEKEKTASSQTCDFERKDPKTQINPAEKYLEQIFFRFKLGHDERPLLKEGENLSIEDVIAVRSLHQEGHFTWYPTKHIEIHYRYVHIGSNCGLDSFRRVSFAHTDASRNLLKVSELKNLVKIDPIESLALAYSPGPWIENELEIFYSDGTKARYKVVSTISEPNVRKDLLLGTMDSYVFPEEMQTLEFSSESWSNSGLH